MVIHLRGVSVRYAGKAVLDRIDLDVQAGECMLVSGPSGCGKSTLAHVISGLIPHAIPASVEGTVQVCGADTQAVALYTLAGRVGMVFQNPSAQLFHLRVDDETAFGVRNLGLDEQLVRQRVDWALEATGLERLRDRRPAELSGGQKQCLAIAAVLAMRPEILVLDEPTASLDLASTRLVVQTLRNLRRQYGITILLIEHRLAEVAGLAERVVLMEGGRIVADGRPPDIFANRQLCNRLGLRRPVDQPLRPWTALIQADEGPPDGGRRNGQTPLLTLKDVSAGYAKHPVIQNINLAVHPGEFIALVGENGSGKTTLALTAAGLLKPLQGQVRFSNGKRPRPGLDIALLFQNPAEQLFCDSVAEEVAFAPRNYDCFDEQYYRQLLKEADLTGLTTRRPASLSVGQQQRTALAACLALRPKLIILDEPTLGQDWGHLQRLMDFLHNLNRQGTACLLISHDYKLIHYYLKLIPAAKVVLIKDGHIQRQGFLRNTPRDETLHA